MGIKSNLKTSRLAKFMKNSSFDFMFWFYEKMNKTPSRKIWFLSIPFCIIAAYYFIIYHNGCFFVNDDSLKVPFLNDYSNSFALAYILLISYFYSGYYEKCSQLIVSEQLNLLPIEKRLYINKYKIWRKRCNLICFIVAIFATILVILYVNSDPVTWGYHLKQECMFGIIYYYFVIFITWYMSGYLFFSSVFTVILSTSNLYRTTIIHLNGSNFDNCFGLKRTSKILLQNISLAIFYVLGLIVIIITDYVTQKSTKKENFFYQYFLADVISLLIIIIYLASTVIPLTKCISLIQEKKALLISQCDEEITKLEAINHNELSISDAKRRSIEIEILNNKRQRLQMVEDSLIATTDNKIILLSSILIPVIGILVQVIRL
ncbi:MAG: hypothetical protein QM689_01655 [Oscillospiraceae bacterium]